MRMSGNTVLITGGATGIGFSLAKLFLEAGNEVMICGRRKERLLEAREKLPKVQIHVCDAAKEEDQRALQALVATRFNAINILVNNAGIQRDIDFTKGVDDFLAGENEVTINLEAPIVLSGLFIPLLTGKDNAAIVIVSSGLGFVFSARTPVYSATKAGLHAFTMALRHQLSKSGIKVFEVIPPAVDTELNPEGRAKRGNFKADLKPDQFAASVMKDLENDKQEIGYGPSEGWIRMSRDDLDRSFQQLNSRW